MGTVYQIARIVLRFLYGVFAAFFMYNPSAQAVSIPTLITQLLGNPCEIQNGLFGMLLLPSNAVLIGLILVVSGVVVLGMAFYKTLSSWLGNAFAVVTSALSYLTSALRIGERRYGYGGRYGGGREGYSQYGYGEEGNLFSRMALALTLILVGAVLVAASQDQSGSIASLTSTLGSLFSGIIMTIAAALFNATNSLIAVSLGQTVVPLCQL
jgi:small-conductance mechanosensitive channel